MQQNLSNTGAEDTAGTARCGMKGIKIMLALLLVTQWLTLCLWFYWMYLDPDATEAIEECPAVEQGLETRAGHGAGYRNSSSRIL